jgi:hypothetical protein
MATQPLSVDLGLELDTDGAQPEVLLEAGEVAIYAWGNWGAAGAQLHLETSPDKVTWFRHEDATFTGDTWVNGSLGNVWVRAYLENADGATELNLSLRPRVPYVNRI